MPAPGAYPWPAPPYAPARRTNALAVVSLVAGCAQPFFWFVASIVAVVTGHIARRQIKRSGEHGAGMALAGVILGYLGLALTLAVVGGLLVFVFGFSGSIAQREARDDARAFGRAIVREVSIENDRPRDPSLLLRVFVAQTERFGRGGCCDSDRLRLADGTRFEDATPADWERVGWRVEVTRTLFYTRRACLTVPPAADLAARVDDGPCPQ